MERTLDLSYDEIVVGADLSALFYSYVKKVPIIYLRLVKPYNYGFDENYEHKIKQYEFFHHLISMHSLSPFNDKVQSITVQDDSLRVSTKSNFIINIKFKKLVISDDYMLGGLPEIIGKTNNYNCVIDHLSVDERVKLPLVDKRDDNVISTIFYDNKLVKGRRHHKQLVVNSRLTDEELKMQEFSESYIRLRLLRLFPDLIVVIHYKREVHALGKNLYDLPDNMRILIETPQEIFKLEKVENRTHSLMEDKIWKRQENLTTLWNILPE